MKLEEWTEPVAGMGRAVRRGASHAWEVTRDRAEDALYDGERMVRRNPVSSLLGSWGFGVVLGLALGLVLRQKESRPPSLSSKWFKAMGCGKAAE